MASPGIREVSRVPALARMRLRQTSLSVRLELTGDGGVSMNPSNGSKRFDTS